MLHREWMRSVLSRRPDLTAADVERTRRLMDAAVLDALVSGYEALIPCVTLPDPNDHHVLAAAITCRASCIVTFNVADFPPERLKGYGLHAVHPDDFLLDVESIDPTAFAWAVREDFHHYRAPRLTLPTYCRGASSCGCARHR